PSGAPDHASGGDVSSPEQVYFVGMLPPSTNADDMSLKVIPLVPDECCAVVVLVCALSNSAGAVPDEVSSFCTAPCEHAPNERARMPIAAAVLVMAGDLLRGMCQKLFFTTAKY